MTIRFESTGPAVTAETIDEFEQTLPGGLPEDYRRFLSTTNGGRPEPNWWPPEVNDGDFGVHSFLHLGDDDDQYSLIYTRQLFEGRVPAHLLVVADDDGGNQLCLSLADADRGSVWFFDHELERDPDDGQDPNLLTYLTDSFTDFLTTLEPEPSLEEMRRRTGTD